MINRVKNTISSVVVTGLMATTVFAGDLVINFDDLNPGPKKAFDDAVAAFEAANPDINVTVNNKNKQQVTLSVVEQLRLMVQSLVVDY